MSRINKTTRLPAPLTYGIEEVARLLGVGRNQAYQAARNGDLPTIRLGKRLLVSRIALHKILVDGKLQTRSRRK